MAKTYNTAQGKRIDIDSIRLTNEDVIAVGNMKVNARGDQLGPGGKVTKTRDAMMKDYYSLNSPVAADSIIPQQPEADVLEQAPVLSVNSGLDEEDMGDSITVTEPVPTESVVPVVPEVTPAMRGSLASALTQKSPATVTQKELLPPKKANGIQRF